MTYHSGLLFNYSKKFFQKPPKPLTSRVLKMTRNIGSLNSE